MLVRQQSVMTMLMQSRLLRIAVTLLSISDDSWQIMSCTLYITEANINGLVGDATAEVWCEILVSLNALHAVSREEKEDKGLGQIRHALEHLEMSRHGNVHKILQGQLNLLDCSILVTQRSAVEAQPLELL
jgi:hypothetical protein